MSSTTTYDIVVLGSGPAGQKAAIRGAKAGRRVAVVESQRTVGGWCVHRGTIPSKTLRESAAQLARLRTHEAAFDLELRPRIEIRELLLQMEEVINAHERLIRNQLERNDVERIHGRARFLDPQTLSVLKIDGSEIRITGEKIIVATGSRPRSPEGFELDHENILDSDSILSMTYLPRSLTVLGSGVIGCEYASILGALGVEVTIVDRAERPLGFLPEELTTLFLGSFESRGGKFLGGRRVRESRWNGISEVVTTLEDGETLRAEKMLVSQGRVANLDGLHIEAAGLSTNSRGRVDVDNVGRTAVPHIYAVGDIVGPPGLASAAMEQGRRAAGHAVGDEIESTPRPIPAGIYTIPEISVIGLDEAEALRQHGGVSAGHAHFRELARGQISGIRDGLLKLIADPQGRRLLGVQIIGEGATELIHIGQLALGAPDSIDLFVDQVFNFPTLAEAYRVAALDIVNRRDSDFSADDVAGESPALA